jgi:ABC-type Fe3+ transport system permease subunit
MKTILRPLAALELLFVSPAVLFMAALFVRSIQPQQYEPAHSAQLIVDWYAARPHIGLWLLLIALPLSVVGIGLATLMREWHHNQQFRDAALRASEIIRSHWASFLIACATVVACGVLAVVAFHLLTA